MIDFAALGIVINPHGPDEQHVACPRCRFNSRWNSRNPMEAISLWRRMQRPDVQLEHDIQRSYRTLISAPDRAARIAAWQAMVCLIKQRSPAAIERVEHARGLAS